MAAQEALFLSIPVLQMPQAEEVLGVIQETAELLAALTLIMPVPAVAVAVAVVDLVDRRMQQEPVVA